jgi:S-adenosylmethionine hydrolase
MTDSAPPVVTFTTDFGVSDFYVAAMKAALLRHCPRAVMVDITHAVPRHDIRFGAIMIERALSAFPPGTVHVGVVDPGVGTDRRLIAATWPALRQTVLCPDNGLITWAVGRLGPAEVRELTWRPSTPPSNVFHGRDILAPAAGLLAAGVPIGQIAGEAVSPLLLPVRPARAIDDDVCVIHIDHYGNATTNLPATLLGGWPDWRVRVGGRELIGLCRTYHDVPVGEPLILVGSSGLLEIAVCEGSAQALLGLRAGDAVMLRRA